MATKFRGVHGGTPTGPSLCRTCRKAVWIRGKKESEEMLKCRELAAYGSISGNMLWEAYDCSEYDDKRKPYISTMEKTAWILSSDSTTKRIGGFVKPGTPEHQKLIDDK